MWAFYPRLLWGLIRLWSRHQVTIQETCSFWYFRQQSLQGRLPVLYVFMPVSPGKLSAAQESWWIVTFKETVFGIKTKRRGKYKTCSLHWVLLLYLVQKQESCSDLMVLLNQRRKLWFHYSSNFLFLVLRGSASRRCLLKVRDILTQQWWKAWGIYQHFRKYAYVIPLMISELYLT